LRHYTTNQKVVGSFPDAIIGIFFVIDFRPHYDPATDSDTDRNEYKKYCIEDIRKLSIGAICNFAKIKGLF